MKKNALLLGAALVIGACLGAWAEYSFLRSETWQSERPIGPVDFEDERAKWGARIKDNGGVAAYAEFAEAVENLPPQQQHTLAHLFGAELLDAEDLPGLSVCDARFSFGCFHEFIGQAIARYGLPVVLQLNDRCVAALPESPLSCQHGIGHGLLAFLGYDELSVIRALAECRDLPYNDPIGGCYGGVFMEYNLHTMLSDGKSLREPGKGESMLTICHDLSDAYQSACHFWQPQWWQQVLKSRSASTNESFSAMGALCEEQAGENGRACFEGIGNIAAAEANFDAEATRRACEHVSPESNHQLFCKAIAANSLFVGGAGKKGDASGVCRGLAGEEERFCLAYARNELNVARPDFLSETNL